MNLTVLYKTLRLFGVISVIVVGHLLVANLLPYPFNHINIVFAALLWFILIPVPANVFWLSLFVLYFSELFTGMPFGLNSLSLLISTSIMNRLLVTIFTNRSLPLVALSAVIGLFIYRLILVLFRFIHHLITGTPFSFTSEVIADLSWEITLTALFLLVFHTVILLVIKRLYPAYIPRKTAFYG